MARVARFSREEFVTRRFHYEPGQHVSWIGPTGSGKTTFALQLLERWATPAMPSVTLVMKPRDETAERFAKSLGHKRITTWPPLPALPWEDPRPGLMLWPKFTFDPDTDDANLHDQFRKAILDCYQRGGKAAGSKAGNRKNPPGVILFADEAWGLCQELGLTKELTTVWTKGRSMNCGLWSGTQKPSHVPLHMYNQAQHIFLANDPDEQARRRFGEIGGIDPKLVRELVGELDQFEWLYIGRRGPVLCVVEP